MCFYFKKFKFRIVYFNIRVVVDGDILVIYGDLLMWDEIYWY